MKYFWITDPPTEIWASERPDYVPIHELSRGAEFSSEEEDILSNSLAYPEPESDELDEVEPELDEHIPSPENEYPNQAPEFSSEDEDILISGL
jgi:hypothetical protein